MSQFSKVSILSLGLMGGSLAAALKQRNLAQTIVGWGYREASLEKALVKGYIDSYSLDLAEAVDGAEIVIICSPAKVAETVLLDVVRLASNDTIISDVASVKENLSHVLIDAFGRVPANVVLAHPIAGSENSGIDAANAQLYVDHNVILTPANTSSNQAKQKVTALWQAVGANVSEMPVDEHDRILAGTSHLPHLLAFNMVGALAKLPTSHDVFKYAAGGLRDFTRIAASDPQMWAEIALTNKQAILNMMAMYHAEFQALVQEIETEDEQALIERFRSAKASRDHFSALLSKRHGSGV